MSEPREQILIDHDWNVTFQSTPIQMRGRFDSVEAFLKRKAEWELRAEVICVTWRMASDGGSAGGNERIGEDHYVRASCDGSSSVQ